MECGLQWKDITCWDEVPRLTLTHEETLEAAIPDYCPDMGRVVEASGTLCLRSITARSGSLELKGTARVTVLYTSEESVGLRSLTQAVPFVCTAENRPLAACQVLWAAGRLLLCEAQALTPRRLSLRLMPEWTVCGYTCTTVQLCCGVEEDPALRLRRREHELYMTAAMAERECAVAGEVTVPAGQPAPEDLLLCRLYPQIASCQLVGAKLLVKGELTLCALYRCQQQKLHTYTAAVPFSQIVDSPAGGEEGDVAARVQLICGEARLLRTEESSGFSVSAELRLLLRITRKETVSCVTDLYSTHCGTKLETTERFPAPGAGAPRAAGGGPASGFRPSAALRVRYGYRLRALRRRRRYALRRRAYASAVSGRGGGPGRHRKNGAAAAGRGRGLYPVRRAGGSLHRQRL